MPFHIRAIHDSAGGRAGEVYELESADMSVRAEIWPQWGFNCLRWQMRRADSCWDDLLYAAPEWKRNPVATRSGHPILFPFPGRLRRGTFQYRGIPFRLPANDSTGQHAIHGFTPRNPWRVVQTSAEAAFASVTGEFCLSKDLPEDLIHWPADFTLRIAYRLLHDRLRVEATLDSHGPEVLPFGLGFHPYFRLPAVNERSINDYRLTANMNAYWETVDQIPTGSRKRLTERLDFRIPRRIGPLELDDVLTDVVRDQSTSSGLIELATLAHQDSPVSLHILADSSFRELVLFTPTHREGIAIEPYTCSPDAPNLAERGLDSGWGNLQGGGRWTGVVEYRLGGVE